MCDAEAAMSPGGSGQQRCGSKRRGERKQSEPNSTGRIHGTGKNSCEDPSGASQIVQVFKHRERLIGELSHQGTYDDNVIRRGSHRHCSGSV